MKIFADLKITDTSVESRRSEWNVWPDSCLLLSNRPLFVPDFDKAFFAIPAIAAKIGRIGKNIATRFAHRYVSRTTLALIILPETAIEDYIERHLSPPSSMVCFDSAIVIGDFDEGFEGLPSELGLKLEFHRSGDDGAPISFEKVAQTGKIIDIISDFSVRNTLKNGDIALAPIPGFKQQVREGDVFRGFLTEKGFSKPSIETRFK